MKLNPIARFSSLALVASVAAIMVSCGSDDDSSLSGPSQIAPSAPAASGASPASSLPLSVAVEWEVVPAAGVVAGHTQQSYRFMGKVTGGVSPYTYRWTFGDGTPPVEGNPVTHKYGRPGSYAVAVAVRDAAGATARSDSGGDLAIEITASPFSLSCHVSPKEGEAPLEVELRAEPAGNVGPIAWHWDLGDGASAEQRIVSHVYDPSGPTGNVPFTATATARDGLGRTVQCSKEIVVLVPSPPAPPTPPAPSCLDSWTTTCVEGSNEGRVIDADGCLASGPPPSSTPPAGRASAVLRNLSPDTQNVTLTYAGGRTTTWPIGPGSSLTATAYCPPAGTNNDGPMTFTWDAP